MSKKKQSRRSFVVFVGLVGALTLTGTLLLVLAPAPLSPSASGSIFAMANESSTFDTIFDTRVPVANSRWKYIFIHHSSTAAGNALTLGQMYGTLGDHFVIGNGDGAADGELQIGHRWDQQTTAAPPPGASAIAPTCISVSLIGDFDRSLPTPVQLRRLNQLVNALQSHFHIPASNILLIERPGTPASPGKYFPVAAFRDQLLP